MATTALVRAMAGAEAKIWQGASRLILGALTSPPAFPAKIEDVLDPADMSLETGWSDFGFLNEDGVEITREFEMDEGIAVDQRAYMLRENASVATASMSLTATSLYTDIDTMIYLWQLDSPSTVIAAAVGPPAVAAQHAADIGTPTSLVPRRVCVLQQNAYNNKIRMFAFRAAVVIEPAPIGVRAREASMNEFTLYIQPDLSITDGSDFGKLFEQD